MIPLFGRFPALTDKLPYVSLGEFPTPVQELPRLGADLGIGHLYIKRDDISGKTYGGNKPRKLEFLLGDALRAGAKEVITFGGAGSNHALATALYAHQLGLKSISMLMPQPNAKYVCRNLLMGRYCGAELHSCGAELHQRRTIPLVYLATTWQFLRNWSRNRRWPYLIPPGGSSSLGAVGFVNAAFELKAQIDRNEIPEPDYLYVATGTMGTAAGLMLGLRAANLKTRVVPVRVIGKKFVNINGMLKLIQDTNSLLYSADQSFPHIEFSEQDIGIRDEFFGQQYALFTKEGMQACKLIEERESIKLDGTYTGKTMAALIHDAEDRELANKVVLFWNTLNSRDLSNGISAIDYHVLPKPFHVYFEAEAQPLDRNTLAT
jgi:1-aminocyclopropane-1-carboxylate deaminase/D-cysteine desulfhydrase-like pyridoxal-dependent ACC family enzyme